MHTPNLYRPVQEFVDNLQKSGGKPLYELTPEEARNVLRSVQKSEVLPTAARITEINVPLSDRRSMRLLLVKPEHTPENLPLVFYIHGGGWVMGDETTHDRLIRQMANDIPAAVAFPVYTPSPEAQYPQTTNDLSAAFQYIVAHAEEYGVNEKLLAVAGDSVGGNMATVMALLAKKNGNNPEISFQLLLYPVTDAAFNTASYREYADGPWLTKKAMEWFWQQYAPEEKSRQEIYASPLRASPEDLSDLPPALIITDENDVLRDEGEAYARKLNEAGVPVSSVRINGTIHDFLVLNALADTEPTREAYKLAVNTLQNALNLPEKCPS